MSGLTPYGIFSTPAFVADKARPRMLPAKTRPRSQPHPYVAWGDPSGTTHEVKVKLGDGRETAYRLRKERATP